MSDFGIGEIAAAASLAGTATSALGAITAGNANAAAASYAAQVARNNETIANQNANYAIAAGERKATDQALKERQQRAAITAGLAGHGIDVNTGSAADVRVSQAELGQLDVETVRQQGAVTAYGYRTQATNYGAQAKLDTMQADNDVASGWLKGVGSLLSAAPQLTKFGTSSKTDPGSSDYSGSPGLGTGGLY